MERKFLIWITKFFDQLTGNKTVFLIQCSRRNPFFIVGTEGGDGDYLRPVQIAQCFSHEQGSDPSPAVFGSNRKAANLIVPP